MSEKQPNISVVMVSFNTGPILTRAIEAVLVQEALHELIVVDNGNAMEVLSKLQDWAKQESRLKIISGQGNIGFSAGCNLGAKQAGGDYLLLLNPDCIIPKGALCDVTKALKGHPEAWLAGCNMINADGTSQGGSKRNLFTPRVAFSEALRLWFFDSDSFPRMNLPENESGEAEFVPAISGAFMMMERARYDAIAGMDEGYFFHVEDLDFCKTIHEKGGKILYVPSVKAVHYRSTSKVSNFFIEWNKAKGFIRYFAKHFQKESFPAFVPLLTAAIYLRFIVRTPLIAVRELLNMRASRLRIQRHERQLRLLDASVADNPALKNADAISPVLVIGSTGQVGLSILHRVLAAELKAYALYHSQVIDYDHQNLQWVQGSVSTHNLHLDEIAPKTVVHTPAIWHLPQHLELLAERGVKRLICFSSTSIMGKADSENRYEQELVERFKTAEKEVGEKCDALGIKWTIFRPTMIYGIGLDRNVSSIVRFIEQFRFFPVAYPGTGLRQPVHSDDLAKAVMAALTNEDTYGKCYNLGGGERISYIEMVRKIFATLGGTIRVVTMRHLPFFLDAFSFLSQNKDINGEIAKRMNNDLVFDYDEAAKDFGYKPRGFLSGGNSDLGIS